MKRENRSAMPYSVVRVGAVAALLLLLVQGPAWAEFRVAPYVQDPSETAVSVLWFSSNGGQGSIACVEAGSGEAVFQALSKPRLATELAYTRWETEEFFGGRAPAPPYAHEVRLAGLKPNTEYVYRVEQGKDVYEDRFHTAPAADLPVRFIAYSDSETEPESTGKRSRWSDPGDLESGRLYMIDQTSGYAANLDVVRSRRPDFVVIAGDLVESGGEQRDWDEFWKHNTNPDPALSLAGSVPILACLGNHDYWAGPKTGSLDHPEMGELERGYGQPYSEAAVARFLAYFRAPDNGSPEARQQGRFYRLDYGPVTLIVLDLNNGQPHQSDRDTNACLLGEGEEGGGHAPDFHPGSYQYEWLERQLAEAQGRAKFTFVCCHQAPYSVGPHGKPAGPRGTPGTDWLSGVPARALTPMLMRYGVDAVLSGHDEMWERAEVSGEELLPDGTRLAHTIHFYDLGVGGDGLRGPAAGMDNPHQKFLAHTDAPEVWAGGQLEEGGKHYGHLEVDVTPLPDGRWQAVLTPAYVLPTEEGGEVRCDRKVYDDVVTLLSR